LLIAATTVPGAQARGLALRIAAQLDSPPAAGYATSTLACATAQWVRSARSRRRSPKPNRRRAPELLDGATEVIVLAQ
jgi:hypothetical protein